jgi:hypothetical protein
MSAIMSACIMALPVGVATLALIFVLGGTNVALEETLEDSRCAALVAKEHPPTGRHPCRSDRSSGHVDGSREVERGPHDGFLVNLGHGFVEITIRKTDVPPRFRLFLYDKHKQPRAVPRNATVRIETVRPDDTRQMFDFHVNGGYLESTTEIAQPHEFAAIVHVSHGSHTHPPHEVHFWDQA